MIRIAMMCLLVLHSRTYAQTVPCEVLGHTAHWKPRETIGEIRLNVRCPPAVLTDHTVHVKSLAELNEWSDFLRNNHVELRMTNRDPRSFIEVEFNARPRTLQR